MQTHNPQEAQTRITRKTRSKRFVLNTLALLLLLPAAAVAAPQDEEDTVFEDATGGSTGASGAQTSGKTTVLDEVVVTASRTERRTIDVPTTIEVIGQEEIQLSGVTELGDLLAKHITGHFHRYNGLLSPIGLRGFRSDSHGEDISSHVLILVDGHRVGTGNAAKINMDRVERVEVIKGPSSALYGSAAMGGVVNIITKKGDGDLSGSLGLEYGSFDYFKAIGTLGGEINDKFRFFASVSTDTINDYDTPQFGTVYNTGVDKANFGDNLIFTPSDNHEFRLGGNYAHLLSQTPSSLNRQGPEYYDKEFRSHSDKSIGYADLEYNGDWFSGVLHWRSLFYYLQDKNHWYSGGRDPDANQTKYINKTLGTDQQLTWKMTDWNTMVAGFLIDGMEKESYGARNHQASAPYTPGLEYNNQALFLQDSLDLWDNRINLVFAGRYDRFELTTKRPQTGTYDDFKERSETFSHFSPKFGASVKFFDEHLRLRGNLAQGFKTPTADQLSADYTSTAGVHTIGNPDLKPETTLTWGFGADLFFDAYTVKLDWYHTNYEDRIQSVNRDDYSTWINVPEAELGGLDLLLEWQIDKTFTELPFRAKLWTNLAFILENKDKTTGKDLQFISDYEIKSGLNIGYSSFNAQLSHVLIGPQMITNYDNYPYKEEEKGTFSFWDLTMNYTFAEHWEVKAGIYNLFNQEVEWVRGYPMPERNYRIGLTYKF